MDRDMEMPNVHTSRIKAADTVALENTDSGNRPSDSLSRSETRGEGRACPLCIIAAGEVLEEYPRWRLARTKTMKGHKERLMLFHKDHVSVLDEQSIGEAYLLLMRIGVRYFSYAKEWAIFEPVYATVPQHWHRVASDLDDGASDHDQILKTPRTIIDNSDGGIHRAGPAAKPLGSQTRNSVIQAERP